MARLTVADLEIERNEDPFEIEMGDGVVYAFKDPKSIQFRSLIAFEKLSPIDQVQSVMDASTFDEFSKRPEVDGYFFEALMKQYMAHFRMSQPGEAGASLA